MNNQSSLPSIIPLFQSVEEHLHTHHFELALSQARSILGSDPKNFYAIAIERRLKRILDLQQKPYAAHSNSIEYSITRMIAGLEHVCQMAVRHLTNLSTQAPINDKNHQFREQAMENNHQAMLHRARQQFHIRQYERALQEAERARIIQPQSVEADTLIQEIKKHMKVPAAKERSI